MFRSATTKLTLVYLTIIMAISLFFSANLYQLSMRELNAGLERQATAYNAAPRLRDILHDLGVGDEVEQQLNLGRRRVIANLVYINVIILGLGTAISYIMARRSLRPIEDTMERQNRFTADASHELRTPLTAMQSEIEVALRDPKLSKAEARELLESNLEEVQRLEGLSSALLKLARNGEALELKPVGLEEVINKATERLAKAAKQQRVKLKVDTKPLRVQADRDSLAEVLVILLDNAIKYSPAGKIVEIRVYAQGKQAVITVKDDGPGIAAQDLPYIFERFYRADTSRSRTEAEGHGLGLSIAQKIMEQHHGTIAVDSTVNTGSTFTLKLPLGA